MFITTQTNKILRKTDLTRAKGACFHGNQAHSTGMGAVDNNSNASYSDTDHCDQRQYCNEDDSYANSRVNSNEQYQFFS